MRLLTIGILIALLCGVPMSAQAADKATLSCLDDEVPVAAHDLIVASMHDANVDGTPGPDLLKARDEAVAAIGRCRVRNAWTDQAARHAFGAYIAKLGMAFTRRPVSDAGLDPDRVIAATRALSDVQRVALRTKDPKALEAFALALNAAGVFPKTYEEGKIIGAFAAFSITYDESARLFVLA